MIRQKSRTDSGIRHPPQVLNLMAKLVEEGEVVMGIAEESE